MTLELVTDLDPARIRSNLDGIREHAGPEVEILAATKYVRHRGHGRPRRGRNRAGRGEPPSGSRGEAGALADSFTWDFIGNLQSRKLKRILPLVRLIHSVASDSVLEQLGKHAAGRRRVLVEVNLSGEEGKGGIDPPSSTASSRAAPSACPA